MADEPGDDTPDAPTTGPTRAAARKAAAEAAAKAPAAAPAEKPAVKKATQVKSMAKPVAKPAATARTGGTGTGPKRVKKPDASAVKAATRSGNPARKAAAVAESSRYTPPVPTAAKVSPWYVPAFMFGFLILGMLVIFFNYIEWPFGDASNWRLLGGLGSILAGILVATRYH
jgi:cell division protein CrgA